MNGVPVAGRGKDGPGEKVLNERLVLLDLSGSEREGEGCSSTASRKPACSRWTVIRADTEFRSGPSLERQKDHSKTPRIQYFLPGPIYPFPNKNGAALRIFSLVRRSLRLIIYWSFMSPSLIQPAFLNGIAIRGVRTAGRTKEISTSPTQSTAVMAALVPAATSATHPA